MVETGQKQVLVGRSGVKSYTFNKIFKYTRHGISMDAISGPGYWQILDKDLSLNDEAYGIVDLRLGLFIFTTPDGHALGKVISLTSLGGWERKTPPSQEDL